MLRYLENVVTLEYNPERCKGCGRCVQVCPHAVFRMDEQKAVMIDSNACIECGACRRNCPYGAIQVQPGVGCAQAVLNSKRKNSSSCCSSGDCSCD
ncbi:MAG: 4Fe-4S binding protein [Candidatus Edwardsbacteria bacterium]|nr:4Fe-4S binding protein [Candidatus Edwardsbacteria bacterium]MBU1575901.1 4Fe-4S binding protein [Candidatus Edwardsbacteria bacterium]MBU2464327.1 4Fe-4S binding protein [Candidatus Edwardsbacteria bacterium]MBU2593114.1 4Fe-4S binding protein [Candidatus Edwardsbacteria bacterium]